MFLRKVPLQTWRQILLMIFVVIVITGLAAFIAISIVGDVTKDQQVQLTPRPVTSDMLTRISDFEYCIHRPEREFRYDSCSVLAGSGNSK